MPTEKISKRQELRAKRLRQQRMQRFMIVAIILGIGLILLGVLLVPAIQNATTPVGTIVAVTQHSHPNEQGKALGNPAALARIDIYEDFQCSACFDYTTNVEEQVLQNYVVTGKAYYVFHHFLVIDQNVGGNESHQAANAAECANDQGKFWEYHDMLFGNLTGEGNGSYTDKRLQAFAQNLSLDMSKFNTCFSKHTDQSKIDDDVANGVKLGISGTPTIYVNNVEVKPGAIPSYADMQQAIDAALNAKK